MTAIDGSNLNNYTNGIGIPPVNPLLFLPGATWSYNSGAKTLTTTDATTITSPDTFAKANVSITDRQGKLVAGVITSAAGNTGALSVAGLDLTGPLTVQVTTVSTLGVQNSGIVEFINSSNTSGSIGSWETNYVAVNALT